MMKPPAFHYTGESGVGKSCLVLRFVKGEYSDHLEATIGGNMYTYVACGQVTKPLELA